MNNARRKEIKAIMANIGDAQTRLQSVLDDEQESFDNLSEGLQATERGENMEEAISVMEDCIDSLGEVTDRLEDLL